MVTYPGHQLRWIEQYSGRAYDRRTRLRMSTSGAPSTQPTTPFPSSRTPAERSSSTHPWVAAFLHQECPSTTYVAVDTIWRAIRSVHGIIFIWFQASKAAMIRFYETLRSELGSDVRITIVNLGYVASELTKGKAVQKNGEVAIDQEARDILVGPLPIGSTEKCAQLIVGGACGGDEYITWPSWYKPFHVVMSLAPEIVIWFCRCFYVGKPGNASSEPLSKRILNVKGLKRFLYPASVLSSGSVVDQIHA
ncbi:hypothetical protein BHE74_00017414 [Ensete ventricosum]|nr:hypothetical protein GW17_00058538 [Ensete ventricosum]RWW74642.1 hypothetical protein BHE74_00017414 [Ensete ventricosum]RZR96720.1 hypothetical protein BHM03_00025780 [Ensete ventricosum]